MKEKTLGHGPLIMEMPERPFMREWMIIPLDLTKKRFDYRTGKYIDMGTGK